MTWPSCDFNARATWAEILEPYGWRQVVVHEGRAGWNRRGEVGLSATSTEHRLTVLRATDDPADLDARIYDKFTAYAHLNHGGDIAKAAEALTTAGYIDNDEHDAATALEQPFTDVGNARRLIEAHGADVRYVPQWNTWLIYDGVRWRRDNTGQIVEKAKAVITALRDHPEEAYRKWGRRSEAGARIREMILLARSEPGVPVQPADLDADPWLFNVANGTVDLRTGQLRDHRRDDLITKLAPVEFDPDATAPLWAQFVDRILPDAEVRAFVQRALGYALTGDVSEQVIFICYGAGANGKSTMFDTQLALLGDYARPAAPEVLLTNRDAHPTGVADLLGARLVVSGEAEEGRRLAEALIKQLTGGDRIKARFMRQDFFEFDPTHKLFMHTNHRPIVRGTDHAIWRRIRLLPFTVTIPGDQQDKQLPIRLLGELPGILNWVLAGCAAWRHEGLGQAEAIDAATDAYRTESDVLGAFIADSCVEAAPMFVSAASLYTEYQTWCHDNGERPVSQKRFGMTLTERGFDRGRRGSPTAWHWLGIGLRSMLPTGVDPLDPLDPRYGMTARERLPYRDDTADSEEYSQSVLEGAI